VSASTAISSERAAARNLRWRVVDIVVVAVLGVATGLIFWAWNTLGSLWYAGASAVTPGFGGIAVGIWLLGGVLGGLIIRKPGAAVLVETIGAVVSALIGNAWGITTVYSGLAQGLGAELVFAALAYKRFGLVPAILAGAGAGAGAWLLELFMSANLEKGAEFNAIYLGSLLVSGAILAGVVGWVLVKALASTGALSRFASGRDARREV
jgi:energy-coupling factor transport system substrate-specific component